MNKVYPSEPATVKPAELPDDVLTSIGRLVRSCAEIEDILDLFIGNLAELSETKVAILIGKTPISRKREIALELATIRADAAAKTHKIAFDSVFNEILYCRNAIAHGNFLGISDNGYVFRTANPGPIQDESKLQIAVCYSAEVIHDFARIAEARIGELEILLQVKERREERYTRSLLPHNKARIPKKGSQRPQPQSSAK